MFHANKKNVIWTRFFHKSVSMAIKGYLSQSHTIKSRMMESVRKISPIL